MLDKIISIIKKSMHQEADNIYYIGNGQFISYNNSVSEEKTQELKQKQENMLQRVIEYDDTQHSRNR